MSGARCLRLEPLESRPIQTHIPPSNMAESKFYQELKVRPSSPHRATSRGPTVRRRAGIVRMSGAIARAASHCARWRRTRHATTNVAYAYPFACTLRRMTQRRDARSITQSAGITVSRGRRGRRRSTRMRHAVRMIRVPISYWLCAPGAVAGDGRIWNVVRADCAAYRRHKHHWLRRV